MANADSNVSIAQQRRRKVNIDDLLHQLANPSQEPSDNHQTMIHAARLIMLMKDRIAYLSDTNVELQDKIDRLSLDLGLKDRGYIK